ncbi:MAG: alpha/beta-type small acid-soluble spore protein [Bacillota bacterium]|nr:MAG: alpha/beta-type small acid-soluble spore protein [Bacillota bacterium]
MSRHRRHVRPEAEPALDRFKYEVAEDLGLRDDIQNRGWENMTTREAGKIGGNMVRRMIERAERDMAGEEYGTEWAEAWAGAPEYTRPEFARREAALDRPNYVGRRRR